MDLNEIKRKVNLIEYAKNRWGYKCDSEGRGSCLFHPPDKHYSFSIWQGNDDIWRFKCFHDGTTGTIVDLVVILENKSEKEAIKELIEEFNSQKTKKSHLKIERTHIYRDLNGKPIFRKTKYKDNPERKIWLTEHMTENGWKPGKGNHKSIAYNLDKFNNHKSVIICEGEKDADTIMSLNLDLLATTAPTGKGNWPESITKYFEHFKEITFFYDVGNDEDVKKHAAKLQAAFPNMEIYIARVPLEKREADITDYLEQEQMKDMALLDVLKNAEKFEEGKKAKTQEPLKLTINNNFLNAYYESVSKVTDAPKIFILFSGIGLLSGILNKFYFRYPRETHLNLYILLLAPSTFCRKTVCLDIANDYLMKVNKNLCLPESFTPEALFSILKKRKRGLINWRELNQVKEFQMAKEYNKGLPAFLTDIYDFKEIWKRWTKGEGETIIERPINSILAAGITNWFTENLKKIDFEGGLWTSFLFIPGPEEEKAFRLL